MLAWVLVKGSVVFHGWGQEIVKKKRIFQHHGDRACSVCVVNILRLACCSLSWSWSRYVWLVLVCLCCPVNTRRPLLPWTCFFLYSSVVGRWSYLLRWCGRYSLGVWCAEKEGVFYWFSWYVQDQCLHEKFNPLCHDAQLLPIDSRKTLKSWKWRGYACHWDASGTLSSGIQRLLEHRPEGKSLQTFKTRCYKYLLHTHWLWATDHY